MTSSKSSRSFLGLAGVVLLACGASSKEGAGSPSGDSMAPGGGGSVDASTSDAPASGTSSEAAPSDAALTDAMLHHEAAAPLADPCVEAGTCPAGVWIDVTPANADLVDPLDCSNFGTETVQADPLLPGVFYTLFMCQGIWKSMDYGLTWTGPINTGSNGASAGDSAGGIALPPSAGASEPPTVYAAGIRGKGTGFWKSTNGGVDWTNYPVGAATAQQDFYPPAVDPYDADHMLMAGHERDLLVQSTDGGQTWSTVNIDAGMQEPGGTGAIFFIDTGNATTTRGTWLWMAQQSGGVYGTWRTTNAGAAWQQVDKNEHPHGSSQIYQPGNGSVFMAGDYSALGKGVLQSADYGQTWAARGEYNDEAVVFGLTQNVYGMFGWAIGEGQLDAPSLESAPQPGSGTWTQTATPAAMTQGPAQVAVTSDGTHSIAVAACWNAGLWRYMEP